jgi:carboxyl-terminal processing protease
VESKDKQVNKKPLRIWIVASAILFSFVVGVFFGNGTISFGFFNPTETNREADLTQFWQVWNLLYKKYDGNIDQSKLIQGATSGMVSALGDPYTEYLSSEQAKNFDNDLNGKLSGIGVEIGIKNNRLTVIAPIEGSPASVAGVKAGDIISAINGEDSSGLTLDEAVKRIRGDAGTKVKLVIVTPGKNPRELEITRDNINIASVVSEIKEGNIGYLRIRRFAEDTAQKVNEVAQTFKDANANGVIIDLRDNPGGYLDSSVNISSQFLSEGKTVVEERSKFKDNKTLRALSGGLLLDKPVVVLINSGSASASEILAGALHDNGRAKLVGEKSYGKGSVQEIVKLAGGAQLKVTVAHWYTPNGVNISKEGIKPDIEIKSSSQDGSADNDIQLDKALEILRKQ